MGEVCTRRSYSFDKRSNRTALSTATAGPGAACTSTGATTTTHTYDSADRLVDTGYVYDAFGRTTALPGSTLEYYANDLVHRQTADGKRQTWQLDPALRFRSWTVETGSGTSWTRTQSKLNHYGASSLATRPRRTASTPRPPGRSPAAAPTRPESRRSRVLRAAVPPPAGRQADAGDEPPGADAHAVGVGERHPSAVGAQPPAQRLRERVGAGGRARASSIFPARTAECTDRAKSSVTSDMPTIQSST
ncbi:hypothetical protein SGLAM104S_00126 [Streptomyces glaucescens]